MKKEEEGMDLESTIENKEVLLNLPHETHHSTSMPSGSSV